MGGLSRRRGWLFALGLLLAGERAGAEAQVGKRAPWFDLERLAGGRVSLHSLAGKTAILVIGRTRGAAPPCKDWTLALMRRPRAAVYQIIVADKPWYAPRSAVLSEVRKFTGGQHADRVLIEWYTVFADAYGIPRDDDPRVLLLDRRSVVRLLLRGKRTKERMAQLESALRDLPR